jgi:hypothetical protein
MLDTIKGAIALMRLVRRLESRHGREKCASFIVVSEPAEHLAQRVAQWEYERSRHPASCAPRPDAQYLHEVNFWADSGKESKVSRGRTVAEAVNKALRRAEE